MKQHWTHWIREIMMRCINCKAEVKPDGSINHKVGCPEYVPPKKKV